MGLKAGLQILQQVKEVATGYADGAARLVVKNGYGAVGAFCRKVNPTKLKGLRFAPKTIGDTVSFSGEPWRKLVPNLQEKISLQNYIGSGIESSVYKLNDDYVLRISHKAKPIGQNFKPIPDVFDGRNYGQAVAISDDGLVTINKFVKGRPLYGPNWDIHKSITREEFLKTFDEIKALPDETFADYIKNIIHIRKKGYNIDSVNPNNFLLDCKKINIIDITRQNVKPEIRFNDFDSLINNFHLYDILSEMTPTEIKNFANEIKLFYDRILQIAHREGQAFHIPGTDNNQLQDIKTYLYHKDWEMINLILK